MHRYFNGLSFLLILSCLSRSAQAQEHPSRHPAAKAAPAAVSSGLTKLPTQETADAFLKQMFIECSTAYSCKVTEVKPSPVAGLAEVTFLASTSQGQQQSNKFYVTADGEHAIFGEIRPFGARPFDTYRARLEKSADGPSRGPKDAHVTIVEFSDLQCPHCKDMQPTIEKLLTEEKDVRLIFQNFPLPGHDWAAKAAYYAECIRNQSDEAFWRFIQGTYDSQKDITAATADDKLKFLADSAGAKGADIAVCAEKAETAGKIERSVELGKAVDVSATPTLFINGRPVNAIPYEQLKSVVEFAAKGN
jgi:protein-disulfide isomerase